MPIARLSARDDAGGGLLLVSLDVEHQVARAYTTPGQYVEVRTASGNGYFVLASDVDTTPWQLLVKNAGGAADALATLALGSELAVEGPLGAGFPVERMKGRHVVVALVGSALGVARAVIDRRIEDGAAGATHLFLGLRTPLDLPIRHEVQAWTERGVPVVLCLSGGDLDHHLDVLPKARRVSGYVQHAVTRALEIGDVPHGSLVVAAGPKGMLADMRSLGESRRPAGPSIEVLTNV